MRVMSKKAARLEYLKAVGELGLACRKFDRAIKKIVNEPLEADLSNMSTVEMLAALGPRKPVHRVPRTNHGITIGVLSDGAAAR